MTESYTDSRFPTASETSSRDGSEDIVDVRRSREVSSMERASAAGIQSLMSSVTGTGKASKRESSSPESVRYAPARHSTTARVTAPSVIAFSLLMEVGPLRRYLT